MDTEKILLLILGAIVGFFASIAKDYFSEKTKRKYKEIEIRREKAEELYLLLESWSNAFFSRNSMLILVMKNEITYNDYLDNFIEEGKKRNVNYKRIDMLINLYFKSLLPHYLEILKQRDIIADIESIHKKEYKKGNINGQKFIKLFNDETIKLHNLIDDFKKEVAIDINKLIKT